MLRYLQPSLKPSTVIPIISRKLLPRGSLTVTSNSPTSINYATVIRHFYTRSGPRLGSEQELRASKSLVSKEVDLTDWLSSKSFKKTRLNSNSDSDNEIDNEDEKWRKGSGLEKFKGRSNRGGEGGFGRNGNMSGGRNEGVSGGSRGAGRLGSRMEGLGNEKIGGEDSRRCFEMERMGGREIRSDVGRGAIRSGETVDTRGRGFALLDEDETEKQNWFKSFEELTGSDEEDFDESDEEDVLRALVRHQKEDGERTSPRFDQFGVSQSTMKGLKDLGCETMTVVQEATLPLTLNGKDVMAKARSGTGKTVAFLLPSIEVMAKTPPASRDQKRPPILVLIICPTGDLACQVAAEADKLLKYHPSLGVQVVIGGTKLRPEQKRMKDYPCQMIVATPGKLRVHIENTPGFAARVSGVKILVLDEADQLLDIGFRKDIERIIAAVPKQRQTLLFSATIPPDVRQICYIALRRDYEYINTVEEGREETHTLIRQTHFVATLENHFPILYTLLKEHIADNVDYKILVFCITSMVTRLVAELLGELHLNVREIHSQKSQSHIRNVSDEFRKSTGLILVTSDISARGLDYPDVTLVVQLGMPVDRHQYIHRLGRTGRKGKEGLGILLLAPFEEFFLSTIKDLPTTKAPTPSVDPASKKKVERSLSYVGRNEKVLAYQEWLGYYISREIGMDEYRVVELANEFSRTLGLDNPPSIHAKVRCQVGLKIPGLCRGSRRPK